MYFSPEMQISANVPQMISNAALQFTALLSQTALEASIRRRTQPQGLLAIIVTMIHSVLHLSSIIYSDYLTSKKEKLNIQ